MTIPTFSMTWGNAFLGIGSALGRFFTLKPRQLLKTMCVPSKTTYMGGVVVEGAAAASAAALANP